MNSKSKEMRRFVIKNSIANRVLTDLEGHEYMFYIWAPYPDLDLDFICDFAIYGPNVKIEEFGMGYDGVQALNIALKRASAMLSGYEFLTSRKVTWIGSEVIGFLD